MNDFRYILLAIVIVCCSCCRIKPQLPSNTPEVDTVSENLINYNQLCIEDEQQEIQAYIDSVQKAGGPIFKATDYGCYEAVISADDLSEIKDGDEISVAYSLELLDGTICSQSSNGKALSFTVGKREVVKGLDLAVINKSHGAEFEVIIPYNLAFGVAGDRNCIPPRTPVLYRIIIQ